MSVVPSFMTRRSCILWRIQHAKGINYWVLSPWRSREHGVVGDMRDARPNARVRKHAFLIRTYHGFEVATKEPLEFLKLICRALCPCWDSQTQDLHIDWILFRVWEVDKWYQYHVKFFEL
ncbi:DNAse I-like superfamily protein [Quillaja saponaria]|uniref:DNAse I-like superfamily protein n=1 Tax=Quillaja saponaria TaxID=32244 RepID=A0AAD7QDU6_QUISA|nr:DNAse I-like superfamily protein [Quillaja saponaria]